ncbi:LuxR C-terminal-related transcriptional regulator [Streptomyces sp. NPDC090445]|uniref:LuxR C-terminal-related transcriptional regulator n=1 Tax=Streptomyces sp. NPDC090445 TaxID=3365963 RepID=UPI003827FB58
MLLLAALGGRASAPRAATWLGAAAGPEGAEAVLDRIEASGLARPDAAGRLVFRHPLVCSAVISSVSAAERRRAHLALAQGLEADDPRRLVHEAAAAEGPDEELAARLQEAGRWLAGRGDAEGALLLDRAAALSADPDARSRRLTWAAVTAARGGRLAYTARLVEEIGRRPVPQDIAPLFAYAVVYVDQSHRIDFESSFTLLPQALDALAEETDGRLAGLAEQVYFKLLLACAYTDDPRGRRALDGRRAGMSDLARLCLRAWSDPARTAHGVVGELRKLAAHMSPEQEVEEARAHVAAGRAARMQDISPHHAFLLAAAAALAAPDEEADAAYAAAYAVPGAGSWVFELARLRLAHGSWLRRRRRPAAHDVLREAHRAFRDLRAEPWVQRCARELRAAGHPVDAPASGPGALTGQELRIARLAAQGLTNKEIGQRLHISPRTVAAHLYKIFPRLGITSRAALAQALKSG